uniref:Uncharacterized protein n=1 Tax=Anguilla anguilla TaxID=7936 RepID=A0A0E9V7L5_ANGAN
MLVLRMCDMVEDIHVVIQHLFL